MIGCILLTHGDLCFGLKDTLEGIMGKQKGFSVISNMGLGKEELVSALKQKVDDSDCSQGAVIFVDMFGTSCWQTARKVADAISKEKEKVAVITGVNLPMLVKFFSLRESLPVDQLVPIIKKEGEKGIRTES
jgi:mannose/fructose/sorbose-specific phosphotransferase system IIA component